MTTPAPSARRLGALVLASCLAGPAAFAAVWTVNANNHVWSEAASWSTNTVPDGVGEVADFSTLNVGFAFNFRSHGLDRDITLGSWLLGDSDGSTAGGWRFNTNASTTARTVAFDNAGSGADLAFVTAGGGGTTIGNATNLGGVTGGRYVFRLDDDLVIANSATTLNAANGQAAILGISAKVTGGSGKGLVFQADGAGPIRFESGDGYGEINHDGIVVNSGLGSGVVTVSAVIGSNVAGVTQDSATSKLVLAAANTYTGPTTVAAGTLQLAASDRIADTSPLVLAGGAFATAGFDETLGALVLTADSTIDLGGGALVFADSSAQTWSATAALAVVNFVDGVAEIRFGSGPDGLTPAQLARITVNGQAVALDAAGRIVPAAALPPQDTDGSTLVLMNWKRAPFDATAGCASFGGQLVAPENGGTEAEFFFYEPLTGVDVTDPAAPDFTTAVASTFGVEVNGFGVADGTQAHFSRGESFAVACTHKFRINQLFLNYHTGDESLHVRWTRDGVVHQQVFAPASWRLEFPDLVSDADSPVVFTNVSPATADKAGRLRINALLAALMVAANPSYDPSGPDGYTRMFGVNLAGGEFGSTPGVYAQDYIYPNEAEFDYYHAKNQDLIRLPFRWERVQRTLHGPLDSAEMARIDTVVGYAEARGMKLLLDMHNYARYNGALIGSAAVPNSAFADVWQRIADRYKDSPAIYAYGIMNEPHSTGGLWPAAAQAGVDGVRLADMDNWVTVCGEDYASATTWPTANPDLDVQDPAGKLIYEAHCYFANSNNDLYGTYDAEGAYPDKGVVKVSPFIQWLKERGARGLIGEYGVPDNDARWNVVLDRFLAYIHANGVGGAYWAGGRWWGTTYKLSCEPRSNYTQDRPQMSVLQNYR